jgi:8-oxo-dGTP pyrophosphatase MutT (NUDIX family)
VTAPPERPAGQPGWAVPGWLAEHARRFAESGAPPAVPKVAATVVLLRDAPGGPEAYLIRRAATMAFASGMYAFPGGSVDPRDLVAHLGWTGPPPERWADQLGLATPADQRRPAAPPTTGARAADPVALATAVVCAAVRETFEEAGVLLAGEPLVGDLTGDGWEDVRRELVGHRVGLAEVLAGRGLALRSDLVGPWARWITPVVEPRRYDTFFFVAVLPAEQLARDVSGEADLTVWLRPADAVAAARAGERAMLPPTVRVLEELAGYPDTGAVLAAARDRRLTPVMPVVRLTGDGATFELSSGN